MWPEPGKTYVPSWETPEPPTVPDPLPGTKRYLGFGRDGTLLFETDDRSALLALSAWYGFATVVDREFKVNRYVRAVLVPKPPKEYKPVSAKSSPAYEYRLVLDGPRGRFIWSGFPSSLAAKLDEIPVQTDFVWNHLKLWLRERVVTESTPERGEEVVGWLGDPETSVVVDELHYGKFRRTLPIRLPVAEPRTPGLPFGPLPRVHAREASVAAARRELSGWLDGWRESHSLTSAEYAALLAGEVASFADRLVAIERRETPGPQ